MPSVPAPAPRRILQGGALLAAALVLAGCGSVTVPPGPDAADPACAPIVQGAPSALLDQDRHETSSQGTVAWGSGTDTIVLRCGVTPPGPTTDLCTRLESASGVTVDWIVREDDGLVTFTTYGRTPAVDITVPRAVAPDQPSAVPLELAGLVAPLPVSAECIGPGDVA